MPGFEGNTPDFMTNGRGFGDHTPNFMLQPSFTSRQKLADWLNQKARTAAQMRRHIVNKRDRASTLPEIGKMYFYFYDAKWKAKLPIWDAFPLTIPIEPYNDGFLGMNLHYLDQGSRAFLCQNLIKFRNNNLMNETTKIRVSYDFLKAARLSVTFEPTLHRYLYSHVQSPFVEIVPKEWGNAINLPVQKWNRNSGR